MSVKKVIKLFLIVLLTVLAAVVFILPATADGSAVKDITLQPGGDESMMNFCWHSVSGDACFVQLAANDGSAVQAFPAVYSTFKGTGAAATTGWYTNKVTVTGLTPSAAYVYRVGNGGVYSDIGYFRTDAASDYNVLFVSDAQIGASGSISADKAAWGNTLTKMLGRFPDTSFILSGGDQVDYYLESAYDAFLASPLLRRYPLAPAVGNHESLGNSALHAAYYNSPNMSATDGITPAGSDYWFSYGSALYIVLNTNNTSIAQHDDFIGRATASSPGRTWTVLMFHQSVYSSADHSTDTSIKSLRNKLVPVIDKYHIDVVLSGHDHCYTRTYQMLGGKVVGSTADKSPSVNGSGLVLNPAGTVYVTADSASGSKYYDLKKTPEAYAAVRLQPAAPTFTDIKISGGVLTMTTYRVDTMAVIDTYSIVKQLASGFSDVPQEAWYAPAVTYLGLRGITSGTSTHQFSPDMVLTRGQCLVLLMKAYGIGPDVSSAGNFKDAGSTWYTGYLAAAKRLKLTGGVGSNKFLPDADISRQDMATLVYNTLVYLDRLPAGAASSTYADDGMIAAYAKKAVDALTSAGVLSGNGGVFSPGGLSTRAQMAQVLYRLMSGV